MKQATLKKLSIITLIFATLALVFGFLVQFTGHILSSSTANIILLILFSITGALNFYLAVLYNQKIQAGPPETIQPGDIPTWEKNVRTVRNLALFAVVLYVLLAIGTAFGISPVPDAHPDVQEVLPTFSL